jgi:hypothetical protein
LVRVPTPVNKYPDFIRYLVQRLRVLCPLMGKRKIAETLARAGLHLGTTTVQRISKGRGPEAPAAVVKVEARDTRGQVGKRTVTASYPDHVWNVDLTVIPTRAGFWTVLSPFAWLQRWPFCYWLAVVVDHFSRRAVGFAVFLQRPSAKDVNAFLGRTIHAVGNRPRYVITDKGGEFWCPAFKAWCRRRRIRPRFGAVGKHWCRCRWRSFARRYRCTSSGTTTIGPIRGWVAARRTRCTASASPRTRDGDTSPGGDGHGTACVPRRGRR